MLFFRFVELVNKIQNYGWFWIRIRNFPPDPDHCKGGNSFLLCSNTAVRALRFLAPAVFFPFYRNAFNIADTKHCERERFREQNYTLQGKIQYRYLYN